MNKQHGKTENYAFMALTSVGNLMNLPNERLNSSDEVWFKVL